MPIGDAFLAWSTSARPFVAGEQARREGTWWWLVPWLVLLWLPALVLWGWWRRRGRIPTP